MVPQKFTIFYRSKTKNTWSEAALKQTTNVNEHLTENQNKRFPVICYKTRSCSGWQSVLKCCESLKENPKFQSNICYQKVFKLQTQRWVSTFEVWLAESFNLGERIINGVLNSLSSFSFSRAGGITKLGLYLALCH